MDKGIYTNSELIETLIVDLNNLPKQLIAGQFINFCSIVSQMGQKLINLRNTIDNDLKNREETIEKLKNELRAAGAEVEDMTPEEFIKKHNKKDGAKQ